MRRYLALLSHLAFLSLLAIAAASARATTVELVDLGLPGGAVRSWGDSINNRGDVIVRTGWPPGTALLQPYLRAADGTYTPAGFPAGFTRVSLVQINDGGVCAGGVGGAGTTGLPVLREAGGGYVFPPLGSIRIKSLNNAGAIVGTTGSTAADWASYYYDTLTGVIPITAPLGTRAPTVERINNRGVATGNVGMSGSFRAFRWTSTEGSVLLSTFGDAGAEAADINDAGEVVGVIGGQGTPVRAVRWDSQGSVTDLGSPVPTGFVVAAAINNPGDVVGTAMTAGPQAVFWPADAAPVVLNDLLPPDIRLHWNLGQAYDINDRRQIVGVGWYDPDGPGGPALAQTRGYLLNVVSMPDPAHGAVLIALPLTLLRRRHARARHRASSAARGHKKWFLVAELMNP